ncbi:MAG: 30S ribosomal protein S16 [Kiritimatiellia bacterium]|nr:30S ribosomal protein S16 [Kiritimatiellia bacterium]
MAVSIRLRRMGSNKDPFYRIVAADSRYATDGQFLEALGWYNPKKTPSLYEVNLERMGYWIGQGARMSDTVRSLVKKARSQPAT